MEMHCQSIAFLRCARTAMAIENYRLNEGRSPEELNDLVGYRLAAAVDPFDGKELRYKRLTKGYVIYSIGRDLEDQGGREYNDDGSRYGEGADLTFIVER